MSKKILLILFLTPYLTTAQFSKTYYPSINKAELAITRESYVEASMAYQEAFSKVKYPLALDLYNATVCRILLNDFEGSKPYLLKLAAKGIPLETLDKEDIIQKVSARWEAFKPIYYQIQSAFEKSVPDSVQTWIRKWENKHTEKPKKILQVRGERSTESVQLYYFEDVGARMDLEKHLKITGGYSEEEEGLLSDDYLLTQTNSVIFSRYLGSVMLRQNDSLLLKNVAGALNYTPQMNGITYLLQGIENGKWHRNIHQKLLSRRELFSVARVRTEEDCGEEFSGFYISGQATANPHIFAEENELIYSKLLFHFSREAHDFKLGTEHIAVDLKDFPSCKTAREEMQHWKKLSR